MAIDRERMERFLEERLAVQKGALDDAQKQGISKSQIEVLQQTLADTLEAKQQFEHHPERLLGEQS